MEDLLIIMLSDEDLDKYLNQISQYKEIVKNETSLYNKLNILEEKLTIEQLKRNKKIK